MAAGIDNLILQESTTTGTGNLTLSAKTGGWRTFDAVYGHAGGNDAFYYYIIHQTLTEWEFGTGHMSAATTLVRDTVIGSSNANALVNFGAGTKTVLCDLPASKQTFLISRKETVPVPANAMTPRITNGPQPGYVEMATNLQNFETLDFDGATAETATFAYPFPKMWDGGTVTYRVSWFSSNTGTAGVTWGLKALSYADNEALDASWGTEITVNDANQSAANKHYWSAESAALTISGAAAGEMQEWAITRKVADANDTMSEDARLVMVQIFFNPNTFTDA